MTSASVFRIRNFLSLFHLVVLLLLILSIFLYIYNVIYFYIQLIYYYYIIIIIIITLSYNIEQLTLCNYFLVTSSWFVLMFILQFYMLVALVVEQMLKKISVLRVLYLH